MKPDRSVVRIGTFPKLDANFIASSITAGDEVIVPTTSTSFISGTGLKKCIPMKRSTRFVDVIISVITSDDVSSGKPAPDGYRLGAERLGVDPASCVVFEDAPPGIAAGLAAGAHVVALRTTHPDADFVGAAAVIPDFTGVRVRHGTNGFVVTV